MSDKSKDLKTTQSNEVAAFLKKVAATPVVSAASSRNRLLIGIDATASRAQLWDQAMHVQSEMFSETAKLGGLAIQICYYQGYGEFHAFPWHTRADDLIKDMSRVTCVSGATQLEKVLKHTLAENKLNRLNTQKTGIKALVFIGDCFEEEIEPVMQLAGQLRLFGIPAFMFQEGNEPLAQRVFQQIAAITQGAYCRFDANSAQQLKALLSAVAVFAAGGHAALSNYRQDQTGLVAQLRGQLPKL